MAVDPENPDEQQQALRRFVQDDTHFALGRIAGFQYTTLAIFVLLIASFWILQVRDAESNSQLAERNRIKTVPVLAPRGKLLDRDGRVIVDNEAAYTLFLTRENLKPEHLDGIRTHPDFVHNSPGRPISADGVRSRQPEKNRNEP